MHRLNLSRAAAARARRCPLAVRTARTRRPGVCVGPVQRRRRRRGPNLRRNVGPPMSGPFPENPFFILSRFLTILGPDPLDPWRPTTPKTFPS